MRARGQKQRQPRRPSVFHHDEGTLEKRLADMSKFHAQEVRVLQEQVSSLTRENRRLRSELLFEQQRPPS